VNPPIELADVMTRPKLGPGDVKILTHVARGDTNKDLADLMGVSTATIGRWLTTLFEKLGARDRTHAVIIALAAGVIKVSDLSVPTWVIIELTATREPLHVVG
jgi:two-component system NarL family response regulator